MLASRIPKTQKELQKLAGSLNYFKRFVPGYSKLFEPIKRLMGGKTQQTWTQECHAALEQICEVLSRRLQLTVANPGLPYFLYLDVTEEGIAGILC